MMTSELMAPPILDQDTDNESISVNVQAYVDSGRVLFKPEATSSYAIGKEQITLFAAEGELRAYILHFTLVDGHTFATPALKFFVSEGPAVQAGYRVNPETDKTMVSVTLFNNLQKGQKPVPTRFTILYEEGKLKKSHDPTIVWEPPQT